MALKFRRGTTAQKSGSLAFGEPYVNTTLGTLQIGGEVGDVTLLINSSSQGISGSSLNITGNAKIDGNLTLGGNITIGDNTSDSVNVVASLSSSLIPSVTNAFDLGSETKFWRDLYISTGSIKFVGAGNAIVGTLSNSGNGMALDGGVIARGDSTFGTSSLAVTSLTGSLRVSGSITTIGASTATSFNGTINATNGVVSGSSQVIGILDSLNSFSSSQLTQNTNLATISGSLISSASANTISVANLNAASSSYETKGRSIVSGSSQITYANISSIPAGIVSGSSQVTGIGNAQLTNSTITIGSTSTALGATSTTIAGLTSVTSTTFVGALTGNASTATTAAALTTARTINGTSFDGSANITIPNLVSGSAQITLSSTTGYGTVINQNLLTTSDVRHNSLGVGMAASATAGRIDATNDIVAFSSSDIRFKENIVPIQNALDKIRKISGNTYDWKEENKIEHGYEGNDVGVIAQEIEAVLPQLVQTRENGYKAVKYDKLVALLIEGIKEQQLQIEQLRIDLNNSVNKGL